MRTTIRIDINLSITPGLIMKPTQLIAGCGSRRVVRDDHRFVLLNILKGAV
jgi:hypothetical protein